MKKIVLAFIKIYQKIFSFDHGIPAKLFGVRFCRFHPSCSQYAYESVQEYGVLKGLWMGIKRVGRCHPWNDGGYDPVIKNNQSNK